MDLLQDLPANASKSSAAKRSRGLGAAIGVLLAISIPDLRERVASGLETQDGIILYRDVRDAPPQDNVRSCLIASITSDTDLSLVKRLNKALPGCPIVALVLSTTWTIVEAALSSGSTSVADLTAPAEHLRSVAVITAAGGAVLPASAIRAIRPTLLPIPPHWLTEPERRLLELLARGHSVRHIAAETNFSERTVHRHIGRLANRFGLSNRTQLAAKALDLGFR